MENRYLQKQFETDQYRNQANLVYISTIILCAILSVIFFSLAGSRLLGVLMICAILISCLAIWLNRRQLYGVASLIYISLILGLTVIEVLLFGLRAGFQYYFFNLAGLIMFTNWRPWQKWFVVSLDTSLFITVFFLTAGKTPRVPMDATLTGLFHSINVLLNIAGVANSANYFITIATKAHRQVSQMAMRDYLTNLMNRTSFDSFMAEICETRKRTSQGLGILLLDIDYFKNVNDTCGHLCGDELLRQFAWILTQNTREADCTARYGGEEFVIVTLLERPEQLQDFAERLRRDIESHIFHFDGKNKQITASFGAVFLQPTATIDRHQALDRADKLLYQAKAEGRNKVVFEII